jgi:hypothetical protein
VCWSEHATLGTAAAPTCSGQACEGLDPKVTGCGAGAKAGGTVEIRTSPTRRQVAKVKTGYTQYTAMLAAPKDFTAQATAVAVNPTAVREVVKGHVRWGSAAGSPPHRGADARERRGRPEGGPAGASAAAPTGPARPVRCPCRCGAGQ